MSRVWSQPSSPQHQQGLGTHHGLWTFWHVFSIDAMSKNHLSICIRHEDENDHVLSVHVTASRAAQSVGRHWNANIACWLSHYLSWLILIRNLSSVVSFCSFYTTSNTHKSYSRLKRTLCVRCVKIIIIFPWLFNANRPLQSLIWFNSLHCQLYKWCTHLVNCTFGGGKSASKEHCR